MLRSNLAVCALTALFLGGACSDDSDGDDGAAGEAGGSSTAGSAGASVVVGAGGSQAEGGSGGDGGATYTAEEACALFAEATCERGVECGVVLQATSFGLACLQCTALSLDIIAEACRGELTGPRNVADVDRCIDNITTISCEDACSGAPFPGCEAFDDLSASTSPVTCDDRCIGD